jgi:hypothetical protein
MQFGRTSEEFEVGADGADGADGGEHPGRPLPP